MTSHLKVYRVSADAEILDANFREKLQKTGRQSEGINNPNSGRLGILSGESEEADISTREVSY
jgi:hypothetical protein